MAVNDFPESGVCATDMRRARIVSMAESLRGDGHHPDVHPAEPQLALPGGVTVRCDRRGDDEGRLWYYLLPLWEPVAEADGDHLMDACLTIRAQLHAKIRVDVSAQDASCIDQRCRWKAQLTLRTGGAPPRDYCLTCIVTRLGHYKSQGERIAYTEAAWKRIVDAESAVIT